MVMEDSREADLSLALEQEKEVRALHSDNLYSLKSAQASNDLYQSRFFQP
jgi:hypothetical protein